MIERSEIEAKAKEFEITIANVQRDYVFGWLIFGIFTLSKLKDDIFLKGGNALRKGYFQNTRYSADLDLGIPGDVGQNFLLEEINRICDLIQEKANIVFVKNSVEEKFPISDEAPLPDLKVYEIDILFKDFYGNPDKFKLRVSMDLTRFDRTILPQQKMQLIHPYSDAPAVACEIRCMKLEEIIATKLKCLMQRQSAPDLFDYVYSIQLLGGNLNKEEVRETLIQKTIFDRNPYLLKGILSGTDFDFFREAWAKSIICAKQFMIKAEDAIASFLADLEHLFAGVTDNGYAQFEYFPAAMRIAIMRAARTQTLLKIRYRGEERIVEPYSLKYQQRRDGVKREYFFTHKLTGGKSQPGTKRFVAEHMESIENTKNKFVPRHQIELSKAGEIPENRFLFDPNKPERAPKRRKFRNYASSGIKYIYQCTYCGKKFRKSTQNSALRPHKSKAGWDCSGSYGSYVDTRYS